MVGKVCGFKKKFFLKSFQLFCLYYSGTAKKFNIAIKIYMYKQSIVITYVQQSCYKSRTSLSTKNTKMSKQWANLKQNDDRLTYLCSINTKFPIKQQQ